MLENKINGNFDVNTGVVFYKGGLCGAIINNELVPISKSENPRKKGRWILISEEHNAVTCMCSVCGGLITTSMDDVAIYCWNCGADMRDEED